MSNGDGALVASDDVAAMRGSTSMRFSASVGGAGFTNNLVPPLRDERDAAHREANTARLNQRQKLSYHTVAVLSKLQLLGKVADPQYDIKVARELQAVRVDEAAAFSEVPATFTPRASTQASGKKGLKAQSVVGRIAANPDYEAFLKQRPQRKATSVAALVSPDVPLPLPPQSFLKLNATTHKSAKSRYAAYFDPNQPAPELSPPVINPRKTVAAIKAQHNSLMVKPAPEGAAAAAAKPVPSSVPRKLVVPHGFVPRVALQGKQ